MSHWTDVAYIVFACTAANHLGLVQAAEKVIGRPLPIVNCCKCFTFWSVLTYGLADTLSGGFAAVVAALPHLLALSLLCAYLAVWTELAMGIIDRLYTRIYDTFYPSAADEPPAPTDDGHHSYGPLPDMP